MKFAVRFFYLHNLFLRQSVARQSVVSANVGDSLHGQWLMIAMTDNSRYCRREPVMLHLGHVFEVAGYFLVAEVVVMEVTVDEAVVGCHVDESVT